MCQQEVNVLDKATAFLATGSQEPVGCGSLIILVRLVGAVLGGRTVALEGCSPAMCVEMILQRASAALCLQAGTKVAMVCGGAKLHGDELLAEVSWRAECGDVLEIMALEAGGAGDDEGTPGVESRARIQALQLQVNELEYKSAILKLSTSLPHHIFIVYCSLK